MNPASNIAMEKFALLGNLAATLFMTGVIWFVQIVHYPLFAYYRDEGFRFHARRTANVVALPMLVEAMTAALLVIEHPSNSVLWTGLMLVGLLWLSTSFLQVPQHSALERGFQKPAYEILVRSNWLRTVAWSIRAALMLWIVAGRQ